MSLQTFSGITKIIAYGNCIVEGDGTLDTDADEVTKRGNELIVGAENRGGGSVMSFGCNGHTIVSGGYTSMQMNGIGVTSTNGAIELRGPDSTRLTINGKQTTFGAVKSGGAGLAIAAPKKTYCLDDSCSIGHLVLAGTATRLVDLAPAFVAEDFVVSLSGRGDVLLPAMIFERLVVSLTGRGDITGRAETKAKSLTISLAGRGNCKDITALGMAFVDHVGRGDVSLFAVDKRLVTKQETGVGRVHVRDAPVAQKTITTTTTTPAKPEEKRKADDGKVVKKRRAKEPLESPGPVPEELEDPDAWIAQPNAEPLDF